MKIEKIGHSCVVIELNGKRLLIDPGLFVFIENKLKPEDLGPVDVVLITHTHPDHYYPEALKKIFAIKPFRLLVGSETKDVMEKDGLGIQPVIAIAGGVCELEGFSIKAFDCPHEQIPISCPHNMAYKVNDLVYHPGDSYFVPKDLGAVKILLLPNGGPWATTKGTVEFAKEIMPEVAMPIHDAMHKDFWIERLDTSVGSWLSEAGIKYIKDTVEI